jgi:hypothetical protein
MEFRASVSQSESVESVAIALSMSIPDLRALAERIIETLDATADVYPDVAVKPAGTHGGY